MRHGRTGDNAGGRIQVGFDVVDVERSSRGVLAIHTEAASRTLRIGADTFVLATGGIGGAGVRARPDGTLLEGPATRDLTRYL